MKVENDNLWHWAQLAISGAIIFVTIPFRLFKKKTAKKSVVFFYQMHGNTKPLVDYISSHDSSIDMYFLAFPSYLKLYKDFNELPTLNMLNFFDMLKVARSDAIITNYGALTLAYYARFTSIKFIDVFHGILLLKFMLPKNFAYMEHYDEVWVSSPYMKKIYENKFQVVKPKLVPTGYARTDKLVKRSYQAIKQKYNIPKNKKVIMIAPTWKHDDPDRNLLPFGMNEVELVKYLKDLAVETKTFIIFRAHMLSGNILGSENNAVIRAMPSNTYLDTEELLSVVDILVTDWSSIAFDFMVLDKPVIFIDTKPPFQGEDIVRRSNPGGRFGEIVKQKEEFDKAIKQYLEDPSLYLKKHAKKIESIKNMAYGGNDDGQATERYYRRLKSLIDN